MLLFVSGAQAVYGYVVCIDPGHGGPDSGARGPTGLKEKDVNLDIALLLEDILENNGYEVVLTRDIDTEVNNPPGDLTGDGIITHSDELMARCNIANENGADIFVSIHNNASLNTSATGTETYYHPESIFGRVLAQCVQEELVSALSLFNRGVKTANFYVLNYTDMPAILVESAFISNPEEEELLRQDEFKEEIALGIFNGIKKFRNTTIPRIGGKDRYETSIFISQTGWEVSHVIYLTTGENFPDALCSGPLAYKHN
ncbi:MAG: N-acetylmuramoyl-L-alanine amidase, partial [Actinomycetia bacterium]|nr:N-acetylmuramoyl-L-alanine amidase [Actinomycetes bacterium]